MYTAAQYTKPENYIQEINYFKQRQLTHCHLYYIMASNTLTVYHQQRNEA